MHGDQLGAVGKCGFDLYVWNHLGDAVHHIRTCEYVAAFAHELRNRFAIARAFHDGGADEGHGFRVIEFQASGFAAFGQQRRCEYQEFVFFAGCEFHGDQRFVSSLNSLDCDANAMPWDAPV